MRQGKANMTQVRVKTRKRQSNMTKGVSMRQGGMTNGTKKTQKQDKERQICQSKKATR
ncbi:hypothetical protein [Helicobacter bilis]|uniref:hypothetical protein n=1 Tax=Helicobacter bilis TaxID=37372 RepID=UPI0018835DBB|nr:hypothetical protein [Helicobacter bilis]